MMKAWSMAMIAVTLAAGAAQAAPADTGVSAHTLLTPLVIPYHHSAEYSIVVEAPRDMEVKLPDMSQKLAGLNVSDLRRNTESLSGNRQRITETYTIDAIWPGNYAIEPAQVLYGENGAITVPSPALAVRELTPEEEEAASTFVPNAGPMPIPGPVAKYWKPVAAVALVAALLAAAVVFALRRKERRERPKPATPPWDVAYRRLRELDERNLPKAGKFETFYVDLSAILRYYIEDRFLLHAPEQTTQEFISAASGSGTFTPEHERLLAGFLRHCDRVKFAQYVPAETEMERSFALVLQFVDETVPREPEAAGNAQEEAA